MHNFRNLFRNSHRTVIEIRVLKKKNNKILKQFLFIYVIREYNRIKRNMNR